MTTSSHTPTSRPRLHTHSRVANKSRDCFSNNVTRARASRAGSSPGLVLGWVYRRYFTRRGCPWTNQPSDRLRDSPVRQNHEFDKRSLQHAIGCYPAPMRAIRRHAIASAPISVLHRRDPLPLCKYLSVCTGSRLAIPAQWPAGDADACLCRMLGCPGSRDGAPSWA